jgi:hypothetical protein
MKKSKYWFVKTRNSYLPSSWQGWLTYVPFIAYLISSTLLMEHLSKHTGTAVRIFYGILPEWIAAGAIMTWLAQAKSRKIKKH